MLRLFGSIFCLTVICVLVINLIVSPSLENLIKCSMKQSIEQHNINLAKGTFYLLQQDLASRPQLDWSTRIIQLQKNFGYPVEFHKTSDIALPDPLKTELTQGKIIALNSGKVFWQRLTGSEFAIGMGPIPDVMPAVLFQIIATSVISIVCGLILLVWVFLFWRKIAKICSTAIEFGNGNFSVRVNLPKRSPLAPLAETFNTMADRIGALIQSHKDLTNAVSHELRTPIARIRFGLEMLTLNESAEKTKHYSEGINRDVDELDNLVTELLTYAKFDRDAVETNITKINIEAWLKDFAANSSFIPLELQFNLDQSHQHVSFDPKLMGRAIDNLLQNAFRYGDGKTLLSVECNKDSVNIHVDDNGPGIPVNDYDKVFLPFTRLDESRNKASGGVGLGLAIVKRIAQCHAGDVSLTNSALGGCRFSITWPAYQKI